MTPEPARRPSFHTASSVRRRRAAAGEFTASAIKRTLSPAVGPASDAKNALEQQPLGLRQGASHRERQVLWGPAITAASSRRRRSAARSDRCMGHNDRVSSETRKQPRTWAHAGVGA